MQDTRSQPCCNTVDILARASSLLTTDFIEWHADSFSHPACWQQHPAYSEVTTLPVKLIFAVYVSVVERINQDREQSAIGLLSQISRVAAQQHITQGNLSESEYILEVIKATCMNKQAVVA